MPEKFYTVEELMLDDSFYEYSLGKASPGKEFWEQQIALYPQQQAIFSEARKTIRMLHGQLDEEEIKHEIEKIKSQLNDPRRQLVPEPSWETEDLPVLTTSRRPVKTSRKSRVLFVVAGLVMAAVSVTIATKQFSNSAQTRSHAGVLTHRCGMGERKTVMLPDGSTAILNSNSQVRYNDGFTSSVRSIELSGEAYFKVAVDASRPFTVHSGTFSTTALGTSFYVQARQHSPYKVQLLEGKLRLQTSKPANQPIPADELILLPGEAATWDIPASHFNKTTCDSSTLNQWIAGKLSFNNLPVAKALRLLEQWYGVEITSNNKKWTALTLTGDYDNKPLAHVLKIICFSLSAQYHYSNGQVIIE